MNIQLTKEATVETLGEEGIEQASTTFESWDDEHVHLKTNLLRGIYAYGFENPSPIQKKAIIPLISRKDIIAQAQSGTGKTGAFVVGSLQILDVSKHAPQILILGHTRELARQIYSVFYSNRGDDGDHSSVASWRHINRC